MNIRQLVAICLGVIFFDVVVGSDWRCDYTYVKDVKGYFKFHRMPATWADARLRCQHEGAVLASPYPQDMYDALVKYMDDINNTSYNIFIGVHAIFSKGDYHTIDGTSLSKIPMKWMESQPDNKDNAEDCLILSSEGLAADVKCNETYPYVCYKEKKEAENIILNPCGTTDLEYVRSDITGNCYKIHMVPHTWQNANMACYAEGGYLAIVNSNEEAQFIKQLYTKHPDSKILGPYRKDCAFIGFYFWEVPGEWRTVHDQLLKEAGYNDFYPTEPNNIMLENCGCFFRSSYLCNYWCHERLVFICEKSPNSLLCQVDN